jgi:hypothetical protein
MELVPVKAEVSRFYQDFVRHMSYRGNCWDVKRSVELLVSLMQDDDPHHWNHRNVVVKLVDDEAGPWKMTVRVHRRGLANTAVSRTFYGYRLSITSDYGYINRNTGIWTRSHSQHYRVILPVHLFRLKAPEYMMVEEAA